MTTTKLTADQKETFIDILRRRFEKNMHRHPEIKWGHVKDRLSKNDEKLQAIYNMETTEGEPDVVGEDAETGDYLYYDCSKESPKGRRSICYDKKALLARKKYPPKNNAEELAQEIGIEILSEDEYRFLQNIESFDTKTSSWIKTPERIRNLGGALFADFRYETVFIYHNGADSYYGARGFRGSLRL